MNIHSSRILAAVVSLPLALVAQSGAIPNSYKDLKYPKLNPVKIPQVDRYVLPNGLTVFLVEDKELPLVRAQAMIRTGDRWEPLEKAGLADITLRVMRMGGTATNNGDALDKELDKMAASVETGASESASTASMFVLKNDMPKGLSILADLIQHPAFPQDKIDLVKIDEKDSVSRRNDSAGGIHGRETQRLLYGKTSPYTRMAEYATLDSITREDLVAFHKQYFQPENVILGVWGDFNKPELKAMIEKLFGGWPKGGKPKPGIPPVDVSAQAKGIYLMKKDDINQSTVAMSMILGRRDDPDYFPLVVMTEILGGGFGSRMTDSIRTNAGLSYSASASFHASFDHLGFWMAQAGTKSETTLQALELMRKEIARIRASEVTDDELLRARDELLKGEAFDYDSMGKIIARLMTFEYYGYPSDYLQRWRTGIDKVTKADILRVARKYMDDGKFLTTVIGHSEKFEKPLTSLGPVTEVDYSIPQPKAEPVGEATAETASKGVELMKRAVMAHGGAAVAKVTDFSQKGEMSIVTPQGEMSFQSEGSVSLSGKSVMTMITPGGQITQGFDGTAGWAKTPQGIQEMPPAMAGQAKSAAARETVSLLQSFEKPGYQVQSLGASKLGDKDVEGVLIKNEAIQLDVKLFIDPKTGLLAGKSFVGRAAMGPPGEVVETFSDIRESDGVKLPFRVLVASNGKKVAEQKFKEIKINAGVPASAYQKPQQ